MAQPFRKIFLIFFIIVSLPTLIFTVYEFGSLKQNEAVIEEIYSNQLEAILYSVNQYADDMLNDINREISSILNNKEFSDNELVNYLNYNPSVNNGFYRIENNLRVLPDSGFEVRKYIQNIINDNKDEYRRLKDYYNAGYAKIESASSTIKDKIVMIFIIKIGDELCESGMLIDSERFINEELDPKIQQIARDKFKIAVFDTLNNNLIYSTDKNSPPKELEYKKPFWLFTNYQLGIEPIGQTIDDLINNRIRRNILLIVLIDLLLIAGALLIYRNIKHNVELAQIKSDFISNVSHEIRTPLALISMYIETLDMGRVKSEEKRNEYYKIILDETARLSAMVNKILSFSQIEKGKKQYNLEHANLNTIVDEIYSTYKHHLDRMGFAHELIKNESLPNTLLDTEAIKDALRNIIDNAVKYSSDTKKIEIQTGESPNKIFVRVTDEGIGISDRDKKLIFDKFYRVTEENLAHKAKGTGLGLTIVQHIMDAHNGKINLESKIGKGSSFTLYFPIVKGIISQMPGT